MCKSLEISLTTFALTTVCMAASLTLRQTPEVKYIALFVMTFTTMQLVDALIWFSLHRNAPGLNKIASQFLVPTVLSAELLVSYYGAKYFLNWSNRYYEMVMWAIVILLLIVWIRDCIDNPVTQPNKDGNLVWCNRTRYSHFYRIAFASFLVLPFVIAFPNGFIKAITMILVIGGWLWNYTNPAFGSRWCWTSNSVALAVFILVIAGLK